MNSLAVPGVSSAALGVPNLYQQRRPSIRTHPHHAAHHLKPSAGSRRKSRPPNYKYRWLNRWLETLIGRCRTLYHIIGLFTNSRYFDNFILGIVVLNTGTLVAQTFDIVAVRGGWFFSVMDASFLAVYLLEFVLKVAVLRKKFFKNAWNDLDFVIVFMSLIDFILPLIESSGSFSGNASSVFRILRVFKGIRAIRAFRVLRTIRFLQNLQAIMSTCMQSLQSMGAIIVLMFTFLFMFAVIFREMFYQSDPDRFGTMFNTIFTLFQLLTLDDWSYIYTTSRERGSWFIIIFLALYIVVEYFTFLNLFIAVLVDNFQLTIKKRVARKKLKSTAKFDFEDDMGSPKRRDSQMETEQDDETFLKNIIKENYSQRKYPEKEAQLMFRYFQLLLEIEKHHHSFRAQAATLEKIIDSSFETTEEDFHKD